MSRRVVRQIKGKHRVFGDRASRPVSALSGSSCFDVCAENKLFFPSESSTKSQSCLWKHTLSRRRHTARLPGTGASQVGHSARQGWGSSYLVPQPRVH